MRCALLISFGLALSGCAWMAGPEVAPTAQPRGPRWEPIDVVERRPDTGTGAATPRAAPSTDAAGPDLEPAGRAAGPDLEPRWDLAGPPLFAAGATEPAPSAPRTGNQGSGEGPARTR
jgi:hypothetical protein